MPKTHPNLCAHIELIPNPDEPEQSQCADCGAMVDSDGYVWPIDLDEWIDCDDEDELTSEEE